MLILALLLTLLLLGVYFVVVRAYYWAGRETSPPADNERKRLRELEARVRQEDKRRRERE